MGMASFSSYVGSTSFVSTERQAGAVWALLICCFAAKLLYDPGSGKVVRTGVLPFRVAAIGDIGRFTVSRDGRWALSHAIDRWDSDIMMIDNFR
jgi:hypothetical protein